MNKQIEVEDFGATLAEQIGEIQKCLEKTTLNEKALVVLISNESNVRRDDIRAVLEVMRTMKARFLK